MSDKDKWLPKLEPKPRPRNDSFEKGQRSDIPNLNEGRLPTSSLNPQRPKPKQPDKK